MVKRFLIVTVAVLLAAAGNAKVRLPHLISDNMVIQCDVEARLWGWADKGATVNVSVSWSADTYSAKAGDDGYWDVHVATPQASYESLTITFDDGDVTMVTGVLAGEVWVCAGQSNMEMSVRGFGDCPVDGYNATVVEAANLKGIRHVTLSRVMSMTPLADNECEWKDCDPAGVGEASATGYFFARTINKMLDVPVGLIEANKGGTRVEAWLNRENLAKYTDEPLDSVSIYAKGEMARQLVWYNGTFSPVTNYSVRGIIYYQGCSNVTDHAAEYADRLQLLVEQWRDEFGNAQMPFYFVEIAPYEYDGVDGTAAAYLRERQYDAWQNIPNSGLVGTNDCVYPWETRQIHPAQKQKIGERLAYWALSETYSVGGLIYKNPSLDNIAIEGSQVLVRLKDTAGGVAPLDDMQGFEIAGVDKVFHKATGRFEWWRGIVVSCPEVTEPVAIRYCYRNFVLGNVTNQGGLPLLPFRSDDW